MQAGSGPQHIRHGYFITGTDTGVGKTLIATGLLQACSDRGMRTLGLKPVAAGWVEDRPVNRDVLDIQAAASLHLPTAIINPVSLERPIAPHIAAAQSGVQIEAAALVRHCLEVCEAQQPDFCVVEGAGGWRVPLNEEQTMVDVCQGLGFPVIVVVGMRLGCLNHALLTVESIHAAGLRVAGWVANHLAADMPAGKENLATLEARIDAPLIGNVPALGATPSAAGVARYLRPERLSS